MQIPRDAVLLRIFFGESDRFLALLAARALQSAIVRGDIS
jgi:hypothetical protein